jgi:hypothetical protein
VDDFNPDAAGTLAIRNPKNRKPRHIVPIEEGQDLFAAATVGKVSSDLILTRPTLGEEPPAAHPRRGLQACGYRA